MVAPFLMPFSLFLLGCDFGLHCLYQFGELFLTFLLRLGVTTTKKIEKLVR